MSTAHAAVLIGAGLVGMAVLFACLRMEQKRTRESQKRVAELEDERQKLYQALCDQRELVNGWMRAAHDWRRTAVKLLGEANPKAGAIATQAIAISDTHALLKRAAGPGALG